jgi:hypothetical protein
MKRACLLLFVFLWLAPTLTNAQSSSEDCVTRWSSFFIPRGILWLCHINPLSSPIVTQYGFLIRNTSFWSGFVKNFPRGKKNLIIECQCHRRRAEVSHCFLLEGSWRVGILHHSTGTFNIWIENKAVYYPGTVLVWRLLRWWWRILLHSEVASQVQWICSQIRSSRCARNLQGRKKES